MNFMIVVNDAGELKTVSATEVSERNPTLAEALDNLLNIILDQHAIDAGEYDPADNDTPIIVKVC